LLRKDAIASASEKDDALIILSVFEADESAGRRSQRLSPMSRYQQASALPRRR
jgi:hypothetical protein